MTDPDWLEVGETKNDDGRTLYLDEEMKEVFEQQWKNRRKGKKILPYVFLNRFGNDRVRRFYKAQPGLFTSQAARRCKEPGEQQYLGMLFAWIRRRFGQIGSPLVTLSENFHSGMLIRRVYFA